MTITAFDLAQRFTGTKEIAGVADNPLIVAMLRLDQSWPGHDEVPWCSAFCNFVAWLLRLPRSKSLAARSWLAVGQPIELEEATVGFDVVIFKRGQGPQPGPEELQAPGHVAFYAGLSQQKDRVLVLGGNQSNGVSVTSFPAADVLGVRRLGQT